MIDRLLAARRAFHREAVEQFVRTDGRGVPNFSDEQNHTSCVLGAEVLDRFESRAGATKLTKHIVNARFALAICRFLRDGLNNFENRRAGRWEVTNTGMFAFPDSRRQTSSWIAISMSPEDIKQSPDNESSLAYKSTSRIIAIILPIYRAPISIVGNNLPSLCLQCKTYASRVMVVTADPTPNRIANLALGTSEVDCVYHVALPELHDAALITENQDALDLLDIMIGEGRLRDISELPLDLTRSIAPGESGLNSVQ